MLVQDVADTARWVALYRAQESERPDALFHDPFARQLAGDTNADIERLREKGRSSMQWSSVVRTAVIDELILACVREHEIDTVLMLGAGLDARPQRLPLPAAGAGARSTCRT
jgi:O-methyltransferase involved in polyketide biosynthesis